MASLHFPTLSLSNLSSNPTKTNPNFIFSSPPETLVSSNCCVVHYGFPTVASRLKYTNSCCYSKIRAESLGENQPMVPPYNVLITGSTKGIGFALAKEFLKAGDNIVISSRSAKRVESAVQSLRGDFGEQHVWGTICDVREGKDVKALVAFACDKLKYIDIWINNAGSNAYSFRPLAETSDEDLIEVVTTNTLGLMLCCREGINMMLSQPRGGHIFNIDGAGSDGRPTPRFAAYGATKRSVVHLTKSLQVALFKGYEMAIDPAQEIYLNIIK
ncbi:hypothetical protein GIB67_031285 [Kingdonia uniflora]|uniref:Chlorophyll(Ide) b reductase NOL, chloroplastic n=1 Tax=Kingdonia uniflora TaxID=39325 RepID=A0A7J7P5R0_9MAGN|nr:hypothetical protein GIB67_031285 [Kingdonia uniflora]